MCEKRNNGQPRLQITEARVNGNERDKRRNNNLQVVSWKKKIENISLILRIASLH